MRDVAVGWTDPQFSRHSSSGVAAVLSAHSFTPSFDHTMLRSKQTQNFWVLKDIRKGLPS